MAETGRSGEQEVGQQAQRREPQISDAMRGDPRHRSTGRRALNMLRKNRIGFIGAVILTVVGVMAIGAPWLSPHDPLHQEITQRLHCPAFITCPVFGSPGETRTGTTEHILGTDQLGRDILSRIMYGAQVSLLVGFSAVFLGAGFGSVVGLLAGYYGGYLDALLMRIGDIFLAFPFLLLAVALSAVLGPGLFNVILVLAISTWVPYARLMRGNVLSQKEHDYTLAARAIGAREASILGKHLLPNCVTPIIVFGTFMVAQAIILEAALSFLGLGAGAVRPTWGGMLAYGRDYVATAWWLATIPGVMIVMTVLSINLLGDWLRDVLDPQLRNQG